MAPSFGNNLLRNETSPYLLQHADNPVHWLPWGEEAWQQAVRRNCPVLLSIGYAACHWCHVMERESFVDPDIAAVLNADFVAIKVDREERPDVDAIYMAATQAMNDGHGGWPMTVLAAPDKRAFFAATYLPPRDSPQGTGFLTILQRVAQLWQTEHLQLLAQADQLTKFLQQSHVPPCQIGVASVERASGSPWYGAAIASAAERAARHFDAKFGGFHAPPKFLATPTLRLLIRRGWQEGDLAAQNMVTKTLDGMTRGGLWDWVGGGFSRYSTDAAWFAPHFEKMLPDNALLIVTLLEAHQASGQAAWAGYARATIDFVAANMRTLEGGFCTAIDADSEHVEGKYYTWPYQEALTALEQSLGPREASLWLAALGAEPGGNWEHGRNILYAAHGRSPDGAAPACPGSNVPWQHVRRILQAARRERVPPLTDDKVLLGHNGLMMTACAAGARVLASEDDLAMGLAAADFAWAHLRRPQGGFWRTWRAGRAQVLAALEDCAYFGQGLVALYEAGGPVACLHRATETMDYLCGHFIDPVSGALFATDRDEEQILFRPIAGHDDATPSANAVAAHTLSRLAKHTGFERFEAAAKRLVAAWRQDACQNPAGFATLLSACFEQGRPAVEIVWTGGGSVLASSLWRRAHARFVPEAIFAHSNELHSTSDLPLLAGKDVQLAPRIYVCRQQTCSPPVDSEETLARVLAG